MELDNNYVWFVLGAFVVIVIALIVNSKVNAQVSKKGFHISSSRESKKAENPKNEIEAKGNKNKIIQGSQNTSSNKLDLSGDSNEISQG